jgi:ATP/maltotriose-dependent transcriptional regulator MalT
MALNGHGVAVTWCGDLTAAAAVIAEAEAAARAAGTRIAPYGAMLLAAFRGREADAGPLIEAASRDAVARAEELDVQYARWTAAVLYNGLGRYEDALAAARPASEDTPGPYLFAWVLPELIEAAIRSGKARLAIDALERLAETTKESDADWAAGIEARCRALLSEGDVAEGLYRDAIGRLSRTPLRPDLARAHLLYGEWLRRENRRVDARKELRAAYEMLTAAGIGAFAKRARGELLATGETVRKRTVETADELTAQEAQIARLACDGLSNPEISTQLFISTRTVEWHLRKVFTKLGISSRRQLRGVLCGPGRRILSA